MKIRFTETALDEVDEILSYIAQQNPSAAAKVAEAIRQAVARAAVGDGDTVGVASEIGKHLSWSCERALRVDDPLDIAQGSEVGSEHVRIFEVSEIGKELKISRIVQYLKTFEEQTPEKAREHTNR